MRKTLNLILKADIERRLEASFKSGRGVCLSQAEAKLFCQSLEFQDKVCKELRIVIRGLREQENKLVLDK
jgi:hypothetical protein